jgi:hypothetical protein
LAKRLSAVKNSRRRWEALQFGRRTERHETPKIGFGVDTPEIVGAAKRRRTGLMQKSTQNAKLTASRRLTIQTSGLGSSARAQNGVHTAADEARVQQPPKDGLETAGSDQVFRGCKSRSCPSTVERRA